MGRRYASIGGVMRGYSRGWSCCKFSSSQEADRNHRPALDVGESLCRERSTKAVPRNWKEHTLARCTFLTTTLRSRCRSCRRECRVFFSGDIAPKRHPKERGTKTESRWSTTERGEILHRILVQCIRRVIFIVYNFKNPSFPSVPHSSDNHNIWLVCPTTH